LTSPELRAEQLRTGGQDTDLPQIRDLLNEDQKQKYDAMEKERQPHMQQHGRG